jgi:NAD-dependent dihydropyrimidine dehydrogenase PreA subunit
MVAPPSARLVPCVQAAPCYTCCTREFVNDERLCGPQRVRSAPTQQLPGVPGKERCAVAYVIAQPCIGVKDNSCVEVCPVDCIHSTDEAEQYFINPDECIDCGVCAEVCPVEAIFFEDDLPEQWAQFTQINADFFKSQ